MTDPETGAPTVDLVLEYELDAPPEKVWRAISTPDLREKWLPGDALADGEPVFADPGAEVRYRLRAEEPPFLESVVSFRIRPTPGGGTRLTIVHGLTDGRAMRHPPVAANGNRPVAMRAA